jgi:hypothetical protein
MQVIFQLLLDECVVNFKLIKLSFYMQIVASLTRVTTSLLRPSFNQLRPSLLLPRWSAEA